MSSESLDPSSAAIFGPLEASSKIAGEEQVRSNAPAASLLMTSFPYRSMVSWISTRTEEGIANLAYLSSTPRT